MNRTMLKKIVMSLFLTSILVVSITQLSFSQSAIGVWKTIDDETNKVKSHIKIYTVGNELRGKIIKIFPEKGEEVNPKCKKCTGDKKGKPIIGMVILSDMKKDGKEWSSGTILDPDNGKLYSCKIWCESNNVLKVRGYIGWLYRTQTWKRLQ